MLLAISYRYCFLRFYQEFIVSCVFPTGYGQDSAGLSATSSSKFPIGDISKVITALAVLKLKELGYLELSDEVMGNDQTSMYRVIMSKRIIFLVFQTKNLSKI